MADPKDLCRCRIVLCWRITAIEEQLQIREDMKTSVGIEDLEKINKASKKTTESLTETSRAMDRVKEAFATLELLGTRSVTITKDRFDGMLETFTKLNLSQPLDEIEQMDDAFKKLALDLEAYESMAEHYSTSDWKFYRNWLQENDFFDLSGNENMLATMKESYESVKDTVEMLEFALRNMNDELLNNGMISGDRTEMHRYMKEKDGKLEGTMDDSQVGKLIEDLVRWQKRRSLLGAILGVDDERNNIQIKINQARKYLDKVSGAADAKAEAKLYKDLLSKYEDYEAQRASIREKFAKDRLSLEKATDAKGAPLSEDAKSRALAELSKQEKAALKAVDEAQLTELSKENKALVEMFADTSAKSVGEIQRIIDRIKLLMDYLRAAKDGEGTAEVKDSQGRVTKKVTQKEMVDLGFSPEDLTALEKSPEKLKALTEQYEKLKKEVVSKNPFEALASAVKDFFKQSEDGDDKSLNTKIKNLGESAAASADIVGDLAGKLSEMFEAAGNDTMAEAMSTVQDTMSTVSNISKGFAEGGILGGVQAIAGEAISYLTKAFEANARHKEALEKIMQEVIAQQREYNLLLMEQNLEYEKAETIFGTDSYAKATNAVKVMKDAYADLRNEIAGTADQQKQFAWKETGSAFWNTVVNSNYSKLKDAYAGLADIEIKTGHKKTGLFGWGKGKDIYSSILDVYPELIDSAGNLNRKLAESILNSREFADNDKEALQYMIDLYDEAEEAWDEVKDYFEDIFGDLGQTLSDALVDAFKNGTDAGEAFVDSLTEMLETLAEQMIYTVTLAPYLEKAQEEMLDVMKRDDLTDEQKFENYVRILDEMTDNALSQQGTFNSLMEKYQQLAKDKGLDLWKADSTTQTGKSGAYTTASQESITKLEGLYTSMLMHETNIDTNVENVAVSMETALSHLKRIEANTGDCSETLTQMHQDLKGMKDDLSTLRRDGIKTR